LADRFPSWLDAHAEHVHRIDIRVPKLALQQAVAVDEAWRHVWMASRLPRFTPSAEQAARLPQLRLVLAPTARLVEADWPFVEQRRALMQDSSAEQLALPKRLGSTRHWLLLRTEGGIGQLRLQPRQAQLYRLCATLPLDLAVKRLSEQCSRQERVGLAAHVQTWLAQSMELGLWSAAVP
jgi:hypothetical protein